MRVIDKRVKLTRRELLKTSSASAVAMTILPTGMIVGANRAWAASAVALKPQTFATLVQISRDVYPHDRIPDKHYVLAVESFDKAAAGSESDKAMFEDGVAELDEAADDAHGRSYVDVGWEADRVALLRAMEESPFFQRVRGSLVTGLYNNKEVWAVLGYEGESASKGGYIKRGFDDIDWLDSV